MFFKVQVIHFLHLYYYSECSGPRVAHPKASENANHFDACLSGNVRPISLYRVQTAEPMRGSERGEGKLLFSL